MLRKKGDAYKLDTAETSLIIGIGEEPHYLYYGKRIKCSDDYSMLLPEGDFFGNRSYLQPYSTFGSFDFKEPSLLVEYADGSHTTRFTFLRARRTEYPAMNGLPHSYGGGETLALEYEDKFTKLKLTVYYTVYDDSDVISVVSRITNNSKKSVKIKKLASLQLELWGSDYTFTTFDGSWGSERQKHETPLKCGLLINDSKTGSSSHYHNPFVTVKNGEGVYAFNLVYSGNHKESIESDEFNKTRVIVGMSDFAFEWNLEPYESFTSPEAVMCYGRSDDDISRYMHSFVSNHILNGKWKDKERPVLVNNWEGTEFNFNREKIEGIIDAAKEVGAELFVLDDGWFGKRDADNSSLGDWFDYKEKTGGIESLSEYAKSKGLKFGIWVEPEMISENSELFRKHPEYAMKQPKREPFRIRNQLMLDMADEQVQNYVFKAVSRVITATKANYIKWDFNRVMTDCYSKNVAGGEYCHRYMLGVYSVMGKLVEKFPSVLFESCASGGGRFDLGMLCYMPQTWTSDNTDARDRLLIQSGTSYGYPQSTFGSHVSSSPNLQTWNFTPLETRFNMAVCGALGYEMDMTQCSKEEKETIKKQINFYKKHRRMFQYGTFYRINDAFKDNVTGFIFVNEEKSEAIAVVAVKEKKVGVRNLRFKLKGLDENTLYTVETREQENYKNKLKYQVSGDVLMNASLVLDDIFFDTQNNFNALYTRMYIIKKAKTK